MSRLILFSLYSRFCVIKKNFICKEKSGTVTKLKLVTKNKKLNHLYFGNLVLTSHYCCGDNV